MIFTSAKPYLHKEDSLCIVFLPFNEAINIQPLTLKERPLQCPAFILSAFIDLSTLSPLSVSGFFLEGLND